MKADRQAIRARLAAPGPSDYLYRLLREDCANLLAELEAAEARVTRLRLALDNVERRLALATEGEASLPR